MWHGSQAFLLIMSLRFYREGPGLWGSGFVLAVWGTVTQVWRSPEPPLLQQRCAAWTASAWLEPQRLHERSLRLSPPGTFPGFHRLQIRPHGARTHVRACTPPELVFWTQQMELCKTWRLDLFYSITWFALPNLWCLCVTHAFISLSSYCL